MLLRFRSRDGMFRVQIEANDDAALLVQMIQEQLKFVPIGAVTISTHPSGNPGQLLTTLKGRKISTMGLKYACNLTRFRVDVRHGDLFFLIYSEVQGEEHHPEFDHTLPLPNVQLLKSHISIEQDAVDDFLEKQDGKIPRGRDHRMCKHNEKGMCDHCIPFEPFDQKYLDDQKIKHMSFHAYLKMLNTHTNKYASGTSFIPPLSEMDFKVKKNCPSGHPPWPEGICSKCQPGAITMQSQTFRMVDHVEISAPSIIDRFIDTWRKSAHQRFGFLYGRYEPYDKVPLGIKAVVETIYEPPQRNETDGLQIHLPWENENAIDSIAQSCGLTKVGMIWSDLTDAGDSKVVCKRHIDSYFLSSLEAVFSAKMQNSHKNVSRMSETGYFGSKFVSVVISGNLEGGIEMSAYQISNTGMAMVEADIIEPSTDPSQLLVCPEEDDRYIPEVFYRRRNKYNVQVQENARPAFPVDYILASLTHGFPSEPKAMFVTDFPIENRETFGESQELSHVAKTLGVRSGAITEEIIKRISDFHFLVFIKGMGILEKSEEEALGRVVQSKKIEDYELLRHSTGWENLVLVIRESSMFSTQSLVLNYPA
ncbi:Nuclear protein localization protein 4 [Neolecta irregularis DAH-3]|uniref:Nuclear protein localization protein 4 n=1 Tax=Neolecta irregularis (strain DAH-3) TaxID=1198029 RepID=A0A1U7LLM6_NEOID|nr:Nuclear protein localization protein 4 [Neolecta irregularis DAH-3]|eukprot:OLL23421.1 Nuclear protein localization protein 4 [Neolecta irregularis DAH-3]